MWKVIDLSNLDKSSPMIVIGPGPLTLSICETGAIGENYGVTFYDEAGNEKGLECFSTPDEVSNFLNLMERTGHRVSIIPDKSDPEHDIGHCWSSAPADALADAPADMSGTM